MKLIQCRAKRKESCNTMRKSSSPLQNIFELQGINVFFSSWIINFTLTFLITGVLASNEELELLKNLLVNYDPAVRPVINISNIVEVRMGVALFQIRELHEKDQYLQMNSWFQFHWVDPILAWNKSRNGGIERVRIPSTRVWTPDIVLYNSVDETKPATDIFGVTNTIVDSNGHVLWVVPAMVKSSCKIDVTYFPFDEQKCPLKFGSWTYDGFHLDLVNIAKSGDLDKFIASGEWDLIGMPAIRNVDYYSCCSEPYVDVTYTVILRRKPMFYTYNLVFPCVLLMGIGILVFCLPPESGEKVSLGVTVLLAMTVYQLLIAEAIPPTSEVIPLIGQFFGAAIFLLSLSSGMTVVIMKLHFSGEHGTRVPSWLRSVVLVFLARVVRLHKSVALTAKRRERIEKKEMECQEFCINNAQLTDDFSELSVLNPGSNRSRGQGGRNDILMKTLLNKSRQEQNIRTKLPKQQLNESSSNYSSYLNPVLFEMLSHVRQMNEEIHHRNIFEDAEEHYKSEWRMVALVLDRCLLIIFFIVTSLTCIVIFMNVPHFADKESYNL